MGLPVIFSQPFGEDRLRCTGLIQQSCRRQKPLNVITAGIHTLTKPVQSPSRLAQGTVAVGQDRVGSGRRCITDSGQQGLKGVGELFRIGKLQPGPTDHQVLIVGCQLPRGAVGIVCCQDLVVALVNQCPK